MFELLPIKSLITAAESVGKRTKLINNKKNRQRKGDKRLSMDSDGNVKHKSAVKERKKERQRRKE